MIEFVRETARHITSTADVSPELQQLRYCLCSVARQCGLQLGEALPQAFPGQVRGAGGLASGDRAALLGAWLPAAQCAAAAAASTAASLHPEPSPAQHTPAPHNPHPQTRRSLYDMFSLYCEEAQQPGQFRSDLRRIITQGGRGGWMDSCLGAPGRLLHCGSLPTVAWSVATQRGVCPCPAVPSHPITTPHHPSLLLVQPRLASRTRMPGA